MLGVSPGCGPSPRPILGARETWLCEVCSHTNWASAKECTECHTIRQFSAADLADQLRPLRIENAEAAKPVKWACPTCTYDNWPRATRCIMCGSVPRVSPIEGAGSIIIEENLASVKRYLCL